jgi:hypothetical protein
MTWNCVDYDIADGPKSIPEVVLPEDKNGTDHRTRFDETVALMEAGKFGNATFARKRGGESENVFLSYAPVKVNTLRPLDPSNFSVGCSMSTKLVYSLGIAIVEGDLYLRYEAVESRVDQNLKIARGVSIACMLIISILFTILTYFISLNITRPIIVLTRIVKSIKDKSLCDEVPNVEGGSREVSFVHESFQRLLKVVRFANTAFFAGDRTQSFLAMEDALQLFMKLGNQKAIGKTLLPGSLRGLLADV